MMVRYVRYVPYAQIEDFLRMGWMVLIPNEACHINAYGVVMGWLCKCRLPLEKDGLSMSEWKWIPGWEGFYQAHSFGSIRSVDRYEDNGKGHLRFRKGRVLKQNKSNKFHLAVSLGNGGARETVFVHTIIALTFIGPRPDGQVIRHLNCDCFDNRVDNLAYGTTSDNRKDSVRLGNGCGVNSRLAKLSPSQIIQIRESTEGAAELAKRYDVSRQMIWGIRRGDRYKTLEQ